MKKYFTGKAFISFKYEQDKEEILDLYRQKRFFKSLC